MKLDYKRTVLLSLAFMSITGFWELYETIIPLILKNSFHIGDILTGVVMSFDNVLAVVLLPFFGYLSDKSNNKIGKRMVYIIFGSLVVILSMLVLPYAETTGNFILFITILFVVLISMGAYRSPAVAIVTDFTPKPLRSKSNAVVNLMGALGSITVLVATYLLVPTTEQPNYLPIFFAVALFMLLLISIMTVLVREKTIYSKVLKEYPIMEEPVVEKMDKKAALPVKVRKSLFFILLSIFFWYAAFNAVTTAFSRYANVVWDIQGGGFAIILILPFITALLMFIPAGHISTIIGRKKSILSGILTITISYASLFLFASYTPVVIVPLAFVGAGWAVINVNSYPMVVELCRSTDVGKYTGLYYAFSMAAQIFTPIVSGILLEKISYATLFPYAAVLSAISFITMQFVRHGETKYPISVST